MHIITVFILTILIIIAVALMAVLIYGMLENEFKWLIKKLTPKTPIQKEIKAERKEIKQLEKQKADMAELERLKERRAELFREVNPNPSVDPVPYITRAYTPGETEMILNDEDCYNPKDEEDLNERIEEIKRVNARIKAGEER